MSRACRQQRFLDPSRTDPCTPARGGQLFEMREGRSNQAAVVDELRRKRHLVEFRTSPEPELLLRCGRILRRSVREVVPKPATHVDFSTQNALANYGRAGGKSSAHEYCRAVGRRYAQ